MLVAPLVTNEAKQLVIAHCSTKHHGKCHGMPRNATAMPRQCYANATAMPRQCHANATSVPRQCYNCTIAIPHGSTTATVAPWPRRHQIRPQADETAKKAFLRFGEMPSSSFYDYVHV
jgi:hypothetical protein